MNNEVRAKAGEAAVLAHIEAKSGENDCHQTALGDLLADLMHFAKANDLDFYNALTNGTMHFEAEEDGSFDEYD